MAARRTTRSNNRGGNARSNARNGQNNGRSRGRARDNEGIIPVLAMTVREVETAVKKGQLSSGTTARFQAVALLARAERAKVNVMEERDIQIRGYVLRLPLDVLVVATANPEDYTNRGRIITPLKDRFGSQIRTHYPLTSELEYEIMRQEARPLSVGESIGVTVPDYLGEVVATFSQLARASTHVNQRSGLSLSLSLSLSL